MEDRDRSLDLSKFCCQNDRCVAYGTRGGGNLSVCAWIGKHRDIRQLYCSVCKRRFSERKGTVLYRAHLPPAKVVDILDHVQEGCGMRKTGRLCRVDEATVIRYVRKAGEHATLTHEELVAFSPSQPPAADGREVGLRA